MPSTPFSCQMFSRLVRSCEPTLSRSLKEPSMSSRLRPRTGFHSSSRPGFPDLQSHRPAFVPGMLPPGVLNTKIKQSRPAKLDVNPLACNPTQIPEQTVEEKPGGQSKLEASSKKDGDAVAPNKSVPTSSEMRNFETDKATADSKSDIQDAVDEPPLSTVLQVVSPVTARSESQSNHPHLHAPPHVHHFDTYTLVRDLEKGGFKEDQAITIMKVLRKLLVINIKVAQDALTNKSDVENETYLFRAACSELRTAIQTTRASTAQQQRTERAHLQHDVDILGQRVTQELATLKDDIKSMFNDRKIAVSMDQRRMQSKIQELNYKITILLNSEARSHIEGLRWIIGRRAAIAIVSMFFLTLLTLRYSSVRAAKRKQQKQLAEEAASSENSKPSDGSSPEMLGQSGLIGLG